ncbi:MAG: type II secretion system F family protein [Candidatus Korobacteraceae bacterium]
MSMLTVFLILLVAVFATIAYFTEPSEADKRIFERLGALDRRQGDDAAHTEIVRRVTFSRVEWIDRYLRNSSSALHLQLLLDQSKVSWTVGRFAVFTACMVAIGALIGNWWRAAGFTGWLLGLVSGLVPLFYVLYRRAVRFRKFNALLPDAVDLIARSLRAGHSLPSALVAVSEEIDDPLGPEFHRCAEEMSFGMPFRDSLMHLFRRFPIQDLQFLVSAILLQKETGGNLAELLDKTAAVLRGRIRLQQKVRVHTAQGRMTGSILLGIPFVAFFLMNLVSPGWTRPLFDTEIGRKLTYYTLASMALGAFAIRRIIRVKY